MSYKLFEQGFTADEINKIKREQNYLNEEQESLKRWIESEHVLNILRTIKAGDHTLDKMELKIWNEANGQTHLPKRR